MTVSTPSSGNDPRLSTEPAKSWESAYSATDLLLYRLDGLTHALSTVVEHHPRLNTAAQEDEALIALLESIEATNEAVRDARNVEYRAGRDQDVLVRGLREDVALAVQGRQRAEALLADERAEAAESREQTVRASS